MKQKEGDNRGGLHDYRKRGPGREDQHRHLQCRCSPSAVGPQRECHGQQSRPDVASVRYLPPSNKNGESFPMQPNRGLKAEKTIYLGNFSRATKKENHYFSQLQIIRQKKANGNTNKYSVVGVGKQEGL